MFAVRACSQRRRGRYCQVSGVSNPLRRRGAAKALCRLTRKGQRSSLPRLWQPGDAPVFVEVGEAGIAVDHAMRRELAVQCS